MTDRPQIGGAFDQHGQPASTHSRVINRATPTLRCLPLTAGARELHGARASRGRPPRRRHRARLRLLSANLDYPPYERPAADVHIDGCRFVHVAICSAS